MSFHSSSIPKDPICETGKRVLGDIQPQSNFNVQRGFSTSVFLNGKEF